MNCPICNVALVMADRSGIEIDYCPQCRGVWLDRGELDKIIERSIGYNSENVNKANQPFSNMQDYHHDKGHHHRGRRKSFLEEIFD